MCAGRFAQLPPGPVIVPALTIMPQPTTNSTGETVVPVAPDDHDVPVELAPAFLSRATFGPVIPRAPGFAACHGDWISYAHAAIPAVVVVMTRVVDAWAICRFPQISQLIPVEVACLVNVDPTPPRVMFDTTPPT